MKKYISILLSVVATLTIGSCTRQEPDIPTPKLNFSDNVEADFQSVKVSCSVTGNVTADKLAIEYSTDKTLASFQTESFVKEGDSFIVTIDGLDIQTKYYYRYTIENKVSSYTYEKIREFKTLDYVVPRVTTGDVSNVSGTQAFLSGVVEFACGKQILEKGFLVGTDKNKLDPICSDSGDLTIQLEGLKYETTYFYQAYAKTEIGIGKGDIREFKTCNAVSFSPVSVREVKSENVSVSSGVLDDGGIQIEKQGFRYSEYGSDSFSQIDCYGASEISNLKLATKYSIWYYAKTFEDEFESDKVEVETKDGIVLITTSSPADVAKTSALLKGNISSDGGSTITERGFCYGKNSSPSFNDTKIKVSGTVGEFQYALSNLPQNATYYVRAYATNAVGTYFGETVSFTTLYDSVVFGITSCLDVSASSASLVGSINSNGGSTITKCGFCYSTKKNPTVEDQIVEVTGSKTTLSATLKNLKSGVTYYVRAFATNANSTFYSSEVSFVTEDGKIQFTTPTSSNIAAESVVLTSSILSSGGGTITERGFCYALTKNPTTVNSLVKGPGTTGEYNCTVPNLKNKTIYYFRAYAINESGTYYSSEISVSTLDGIATVKTNAATNVLALSSTLNGEVTSDGGSNITERGFCYGTSASPTTSSTVVKISGTVGTMTKELPNLTKSTKYYVRAYAMNGYGTHYGNEISFTTSDGNIAFGTTALSDITVSSFKATTNVTSDGGSTITKRGFCYSTSSGPTISDRTVSVSGTTGSMSSTLSGLTNNTTYYVRAFATNATGTSYGQEVPISTLSGLPDVETTSYTNLKAQSVELTGNVVSANGGTITSRGFCYGTSSNPTIADMKSTVSGTTGTMSKTITGLAAATKYYVRAYATTSFGTTYGTCLSFTTLSGIVSFTNVTVSEVLADASRLSVNIASDGGSDIIECGFCYSTSGNPSVSDSKKVVSGSETSYNCALNSLAKSTKYYVRAYAKNAIDTYYSTEVTFSTLSGTPELSVVTATNIAQVEIGLSCNVLSDGGASIIKRGFCFSTIGTPTIDSSCIIIDGTIGTMAGSLINLISNQKYYIRAFATNKFETTYSSLFEVSTIAGIATLGETNVTDVNPTSASFSSTLVSAGGTDILSIGFCYATSSNPTISDNIIEVGVGSHTMISTANNLEQKTLYYVRSYATTKYGTSYGKEKSFETSYYPVTFSNASCTSAYTTYATVSCFVESLGGNAVIEQGVCYGTSSNPTIDDNKLILETSSSIENVTLTGLSPNATYYVRRYLKNRISVFYSNQVTIKTIAVPKNAVAGLFSVSSSKKVYFATGNLLQYSTYQKLANSQYYITGVVPYDGKSTRNYPNDLFNNSYNGLDEIVGVSGTWRVLTRKEWEYLLSERNNAQNLKYIVSVNGVNGLLILPDDWALPNGLDCLEQNECLTLERFSLLEQSGVVFLPSAGCVRGCYSSFNSTLYISYSIDGANTIGYYSTGDSIVPGDGSRGSYSYARYMLNISTGKVFLQGAYNPTTDAYLFPYSATRIVTDFEESEN